MIQEVCFFSPKHENSPHVLKLAYKLVSFVLLMLDDIFNSSDEICWSEHINFTIHQAKNNILLLLGEPEELIKHGLRALRETLPSEQELNTKVNNFL